MVIITKRNLFTKQTENSKSLPSLLPKEKCNCNLKKPEVDEK